MTELVEHGSPISATRRRVRGVALRVAVLLVLTTISTQARTFKVLHRFKGQADGANPRAGVVLDPSGALYGTTQGGGALDQGTVFKIDNSGKEFVLYSFKGAPDGSAPFAGLTLGAKGNLYGTTWSGGASGWGTIFTVDKAGQESVLYSFAGRFANPPDGQSPADVVRDAKDNLYGTTWYGGNWFANSGSVFKITASGKETVLYSFLDPNSGPTGGLVRDAAGNLYGTVLEGGDYDHCVYGCGYVFKLDKTGTFTTLYTFTGESDGATPEAGPVGDADGNLYGTTAWGGDNNYCNGYGCGVVFKLDRNGTYTVLYTFKGAPDGASPQGRLALDSNGDLYGVTNFGGTGKCNVDYGVGCGVVFKIDKTGKETILHSFTGGAGGLFPVGLTRDARGNLYGTTENGGDLDCSSLGCGLVFEITP